MYAPYHHSILKIFHAEQYSPLCHCETEVNVHVCLVSLTSVQWPALDHTAG